MQPIQIIDGLKSDGHYFAAGVAARSYGRDNNYGCHFGMTSTVDHARREFARGWEAGK